MNAPDIHPASPSAIDTAMACNRAFLERTHGAARELPGAPARHLAVVSCMDTRLTRLLPEALGLADGDAVIIKAAGATITDPYGEVMRSLLVAVGELGVREVLVVGHTSCGTCGMHAEHLLEALEQAGTAPEQIAAARQDERVMRVLAGFERLEDEVAASVRAIREHPLMPAHVRVAGCTIDVRTGALTPVR